MKYIIVTCLACFTLFLISCKKHDYCPEPPKKDSTCDLVQSTLLRDSLSGDEPGLFSEYRKEYGTDGKVSKVVAGLYALSLYDSVAMQLSYNGTTVYFLDITNLQDTFSVATFDNNNRLQKMTYGNSFGHEFSTTEFFYENGQLSYVIVGEAVDFTYYFTYDANGNVTRIHGNYDNDEEGTFFTYDLNVQAKRQWYTDHFPISGVSNTVRLAEFLGWLPDLEPVNKRIYWKYIYNDDADDSTPPVVMERTLTDHVYDDNGNLVSYRSTDALYTSTWSCKAEKSAAPN